MLLMVVLQLLFFPLIQRFRSPIQLIRIFQLCIAHFLFVYFFLLLVLLSSAIFPGRFLKLLMSFNTREINQYFSQVSRTSYDSFRL